MNLHLCLLTQSKSFGACSALGTHPRPCEWVCPQCLVHAGATICNVSPLRTLVFIGWSMCFIWTNAREPSQQTASIQQRPTHGDDESESWNGPTSMFSDECQAGWDPMMVCTVLPRTQQLYIIPTRLKWPRPVTITPAPLARSRFCPVPVGGGTPCRLSICIPAMPQSQIHAGDEASDLMRTQSLADFPSQK